MTVIPVNNAVVATLENVKKTIWALFGAKNTPPELPSVKQRLLIYFGETISTTVLLCFGCMGCVDTVTGYSYLGSTIAFGMVVMFCIMAFGHLSGAHMNPCVTIASVLLGHMHPHLAPFYFICQFVGALLGYGLLQLLIPSELFVTGVCVTKPMPELSVAHGLALEFVATSTLILICCGVWDHRNAAKDESISMRFGFAIVGIGLTAGPLTGASMNPARTFAPAFYANSWEMHWIYWVGPLLGSIVVPIFYNLTFAEKKPESDTDTIYNSAELITSKPSLNMKPAVA